ncbi:MAG: apolipoprotein N-acyltransferase [Rickettsiales bacterium]|nr:apolipoprotein N-acyltransferase [Rickettsiales bacterium]
MIITNAANDNRLPQTMGVRYGEWLSSLTGARRKALLMILGVFATLSLPPFFAFPLLFSSFSSLLWLIIHSKTDKEAFGAGWWFGAGFFVSGLYWFAYALLVDAAKFGWMIPFAVFGISGILAIYTGVVAWLTRLLRHHDRFNWVLGFAALWMAGEWLRGYLFTGFPWNLIGYSFNGSEVTLQAASIFGAYGLGGIVVLVSSLPVLFMVPIRASGQRRINAIVSGVIFLLLLALGMWGQQRLMAHPPKNIANVRVRLVQPATDQYHKSNPSERQGLIRQQIEMSLSAGFETITHVVWPETAMPYYFSSHDYWASELAQVVPAGGLLLTGVVRPETSKSGDKLLNIYNSFSALDDSGRVVAQYDKRKLVPFGEFVPLRHVLPLDKITPGAIDFTSGKRSGLVETVMGVQFFPLICYESIFPHLSAGAWPASLLNITNDGWFGLSTGPYQHLEMSRMRAVEQGVAMIRASNSGVSAVFDPYGREVASLGLGKRGVLDSAVPESTSQPTFYGLYGEALELGLLLVALLFCILRRNR